MKAVFQAIGFFAGLGVAAVGLTQTPLSPAVSTPSSKPKPRTIPVEEFVASGLMAGPKLSPDGTKIVSLLHIKDKESLGIQTLSDGKMALMNLPEKMDLRWYSWAGNNRLLLSFAQTVPWLDDEAEVTRLIRYDLKDGSFLILGKKNEGVEGDNVLYTHPSGEWILLSIQKTIYDYPSVFKVDLATNKMEEVVKQRADVWEWVAYDDGVVRAGIGFSERSWSMIYRKTAAEKFRKLGKAKYDDEDAALDLLRFERDSDEGYVLSNKETDRFALYKFNFATKQLGEKVFASDTNDITGFDTTADGKQLRAVWYTSDRDRIEWFDPVLKKIQTEIDAATKQTENWFASRTKDNSAMVIWTGASNNPGRYYLYRPAERVMRLLAKINEKLKPSELAVTRYVKYKARDGLEIPAYLTLPVGRPEKGLPLIILPHGGPYDVRDTPDFNSEVQFLANRGYAVIQPNFRGSGGYGKTFYEKGEGQKGRQMQDDLDDGMDWLAKEGVIDPKRVCVVGSSYGGYAALWGATRNPERYRCAASFAGVSDVGRQLKYQLNFRVSRKYRKDWRRIVQGAEDFDTKTVSPLYTVDRLTRPVLLVHGDADQTVPYKQSKIYADALKKAGKPHEFYTYAKEGHGFSNQANFKDWLNRLESFLTKHNPSD